MFLTLVFTSQIVREFVESCGGTTVRGYCLAVLFVLLLGMVPLRNYSTWTRGREIHGYTGDEQYTYFNDNCWYTVLDMHFGLSQFFDAC